KARDHLADTGYHAEYGARPLRRLLQKRVENELSKRLLRAEYKTGDEILIDYAADGDGDEEKLVFVRREPEPIAVEWSPGTKAEAGPGRNQQGSQE
ncbi:MAG: hypothetical protein F4Y84_15915, partial [Caldilineaceae bacterium SB0665_bin_25]|nr:hypothetical protein [Caldilineaceae bacterium SB0665_bin_25]